MPRRITAIATPQEHFFSYARTTTKENIAAWKHLLKVNMAHQALCELNDLKDLYHEKPVSVEAAARGTIPAAKLFAMARASIFTNQPKADRRHVGSSVRCSTWRQKWEETCDKIDELGLNAI